MPKKHQQPHTTAGTLAQEAAKRARLAAELRANLARRKAQVRQRMEAETQKNEPQEDEAP